MIEKEEKSTALIMAYNALYVDYKTLSRKRERDFYHYYQISFYEKYLKILQAILKFECGNIEFRPLECEKQKG